MLVSWWLRHDLGSFLHFVKRSSTCTGWQNLPQRMCRFRQNFGNLLKRFLISTFVLLSAQACWMFWGWNSCNLCCSDFVCTSAFDCFQKWPQLWLPLYRELGHCCSWSVEIRSGNWGICQGDRHWLLLLPPVFWTPSNCTLINKQSMLAVMQKSGRGCNIYCLEFACGNRRSWYQPDVPSPSSYWPDTAWWPNLRPRSGLLRAAWPRPCVCVWV